jgi:hypothetical protein
MPACPFHETCPLRPRELAVRHADLRPLGRAGKVRGSYKRYVGDLITGMQRAGRRQPNPLVGEDGPFNLQGPLRHAESAERAVAGKAIEGSPKLDCGGTSAVV